MAGPGLPENIDATYPDDPADESVKAHQEHHGTIHAMLNDYDADMAPVTDDLLRFDGSLWTADSASTTATEGQGLIHNGLTYQPTSFNRGHEYAFVNKVGSDYIARRRDGVVLSTSTVAATAINAAVDAAAATADRGSAYTVRLDGIEFPITTPILMRSGVVLAGQGHTGRYADTDRDTAGTVLRSNQAGLVSLIYANHDTSAYKNVAVGALVENLTVDGNAKQASYGIRSDQAGFTAREVIIKDCATYGWWAEDRTTGGEALGQSFVSGEIWNCAVGIRGDITDGIARPRRMLANDTAIDLRAGGWQIGGFHITSASGIGIRTRAQYGNTISDVVFDSLVSPIIVEGTYGNVNIFGCRAYTMAGTACINVTSTAGVMLNVSNFNVANVNASVWTSFVKLPAAGTVRAAVVGCVLPAANFSHYVWNGTTEYGTPGTGTNTASMYVQGIVTY